VNNTQDFTLMKRRTSLPRLSRAIFATPQQILSRLRKAISLKFEL